VPVDRQHLTSTVPTFDHSRLKQPTDPLQGEVAQNHGYVIVKEESHIIETVRECGNESEALFGRERLAVRVIALT
jgi:hypothetical protein